MAGLIIKLTWYRLIGEKWQNLLHMRYGGSIRP